MFLYFSDHFQPPQQNIIIKIIENMFFKYKKMSAMRVIIFSWLFISRRNNYFQLLMMMLG